MTEFMDSSTLGTIIHAVLQQLYSKAGKKQNNGIYIDAAIIETILKHPDDIMKLINFTINREYLNREDGMYRGTVRRNISHRQCNFFADKKSLKLRERTTIHPPAM